MPSDRTPSQAEIEAAAKALFPFLNRHRWDELPKDCPAHMDARHKAKAALSAAATARPDRGPLLREKLARASGLAQAIANAKPLPPDMDGIRDVAAEIAALCDEALSASLGEGEGGR